MEISQIALQTDNVCLDDPIFKIAIGGTDEHGTFKPFAITLPTSQEDLLQAINSADQSSHTLVLCGIESLFLANGYSSWQDLSTLNELSTQISAMDQAEYVKFMAVLEHKDLLVSSTNQADYHERIEQMCEVAGNLESYHFENTITTASEYAAELLTTAGLEELIPHMDLKSYGEDKLIGIGGRAGSYGIVSTQPLELSHSEQQEFTQTM